MNKGQIGREDRFRGIRPQLQSENRPQKQKALARVDAVYGINAVREAVRSRPVEHLLVAEGQYNPRVQEIIDACRRSGIVLRFAPRAALDRAAGSSQHQNVVALCATRVYDDLETLLRSPGLPLLVVLDGVEDPANLGAIVRTSVAAGSTGVIIPERRAAGLSSGAAHAAAGALEHARVARVTNLVRTLVELKEHGVWVYGFEAKAEKTHFDLDYARGCALVLGGEGHGLHRLVREACDERAHIPMQGPVESLNVSAAAAVVLYEAVRQRSRN